MSLKRQFSTFFFNILSPFILRLLFFNCWNTRTTIFIFLEVVNAMMKCFFSGWAENFYSSYFLLLLSLFWRPFIFRYVFFFILFLLLFCVHASCLLLCHFLFFEFLILSLVFSLLPAVNHFSFIVLCSSFIIVIIFYFHLYFILEEYVTFSTAKMPSLQFFL